MTVYEPFYRWLESVGQADWAEQLATFTAARLADDFHGKMPLWQQALADLPSITASKIELKQAVEIGRSEDLAGRDQQAFVDLIKTFHPWRKGPYQLFDIHIDTEWRSDWKWDRVLPHLSSLQGRKVLDVGGATVTTAGEWWERVPVW